jgi:hypothetical protein
MRRRGSDNDGMAIKTIVQDRENIQHLVIGLSRKNIESLLRGEVFTITCDTVPVLTENESDIVVLFGETDEAPAMRISRPERAD